MLTEENLYGSVTYTGLEFKEQWSTIISGRKSSLKEAMLTKLSLFSFK